MNTFNSSLNWLSQPNGSIQGTITVPGDKSISHRSLIMGSIAQGVTTVHGFLDGEDCLATMNAFQSMGVEIQRISSSSLKIYGVGKYGLRKTDVIDCGNSGTTMRLMTGLLAAQAFDSELTGDASLLNRPMERVRRPLELMGASITLNDGKAPIRIRGKQALRGIEYDMPLASAQVKSAILLAGLYAEGETTVVEAGLTRDHTERMLKAFQYPVETVDTTITVNSNFECQACELTVPADLSSAAFFMVAASVIPGSKITILNVGVNPSRSGVIDILRAMGASIELQNTRWLGAEPVADIVVRHASLHGIEIPGALVPAAIDEFPIIMIAAACAEGRTLIQDAAELRWKESDRIGTMVTGLKQLNIDATALEDGAVIQGGVLQGGEIESAGDHRIAMSFAVAGACARQAVLVRDCASVATSFPDFLNTAHQLGLDVQTTS